MVNDESQVQRKTSSHLSHAAHKGIITNIIIVIIIITIHLRVRPSLNCFSIVFSQVCQFVFVHLIYNSVLFLASFCCSFLSHAVANMICVFLVSLQLTLFSNLPHFLLSFCCQKACTAVLLKNFISIQANHFYSFFYGSKFRFHIKEGESERQ